MMRFWNREIGDNPNGVAQAILLLPRNSEGDDA